MAPLPKESDLVVPRVSWMTEGADCESTATLYDVRVEGDEWVAVISPSLRQLKKVTHVTAQNSE